MRVYCLSALLAGIAAGSTSSAHQCYGPDYARQPPFNRITEDLCTHAFFNTSESKPLRVTLTYGDTLIGEERLSNEDPDLDEKVLCDADFVAPVPGWHACSLCLGFSDVFVADTWAMLCPKYTLECMALGQSIKEVYTNVPCFSVGDDDDDDIPAIVGGNTDFTFKLMASKAATADIVTDLFLSPFAITNALVMALMAANGETLRQIMSVFELAHDDYAVFDSFDALVQSLQHHGHGGHGALVSTVSNALWINNNWASEIDETFLRDFKRFGAIKPCDFVNDSYIETERIDNEVKSITHGLLEHPLDNRNLSDSTVMLFTNTLWLSASWRFPFTSNKTQVFTDDAGDEVPVTMMHTDVANFSRFEDDEVEVIELPFDDDFSDMSMVLIRPSLTAFANDGPTSTIKFERALNRGKLAAWLDVLDKPDVQPAMSVSLPPLEMFNIEDMTGSLKALGVVDMFDAHKADLRNLTKSRYRVYETSLNRMDRLQLDARGLRIASLVTDGNGDADATDQGPVRHADRPFLFLVMDRKSDLILFAGRVTNPKGWMIDDPRHPKDHASSHAGTLVFCVLLVALGSYCAMRAAYNVKVDGAKGCEAVPHIAQLRCCTTWCNGKVKALYGIESVPVVGSQRESYAHLVNNSYATL